MCDVHWNPGPYLVQATTHRSLTLTPQGHLLLAEDAEAPPLAAALAARLAADFARGAGPGLLELGAREVGSALSPALAEFSGGRGARAHRRL